MLVTFSTNAYENISFFEDIALRLLRLMGHSGTIPGALTAEEVPEALARLEHALLKEKKPKESSPFEDENDIEIHLSRRAIPLLALLKASVKKKCTVMWEHSRSF